MLAKTTQKYQILNQKTHNNDFEKKNSTNLLE